jgi:hypothetical protein
MKKNCLLLTLLALSFAFMGCDECSDTGDAGVTPPVRFSIVDTKGNNLVDTAQSYYSVDSIRLFDLEAKESIVLDKYYVEAAGGYVFSADFQRNIRGRSSLKLQLNNLDSDTLDVWYRQTDNKCFIIYEYTRFQYNGKDLQTSPVTSSVLIVKEN